MSTRYFQHLNPISKLFKQVTELDYIDDTDPTMQLYYFKDGTKCNPEFIASLNDMGAWDSQKEFVEVSDPTNIWKFREVIKETKPIQTRDADGLPVTIYDPWTKMETPKPKIEVVCKPAFVKVAPDKSVPVKSTPVNQPAVKINMSEMIQENTDTVKTERAVINLNEYDYINTTVIVGGTSYSIEEIVNIINSYLKKMSAASEKAEIVEHNEEMLPINELESDQLELLENMITMAKKDACEIDMTIQVKIPSVSLYNTFIDNYAPEFGKAFVKIIANRIKSTELKKWVVAGLNAYYNGEGAIEEIEEETPAPEPEPEYHTPVVVKTKKSRSKTANK